MHNNFKTICLAALLAAGVLAGCCRNPEEKAAAKLAARIVPSYKIDFVRTDDTLDVFTLESRGGRLVVSGNNAVSMAAGLNYYLNNYCNTTVSWYADDPVQYPAAQPAVEEPVRVEARVADRFFLNYCTFGYTMPYWHWKDWERLIDWMALQGINMPLAITGQESVWQKVWKKYGLTDEQIRSYFTGPAHLPWHRMCNIDRFDGPLPQSWLDAQMDLQKQILRRERELGMKPVLPAFSGHVPGELKELYPDAPITDITGWAGFTPEYLPHFLSPVSDLFASIQKDYLEAQNELFGTDHIYGVDLFNEVDAPTWDPETLAEIGRRAYESIAAVDSDAVWLQMGWMFHYDRTHWTPENVRAYLRAVPQDRVVILDYYLEHTPVWTITESFFGQPYILCYLGNFGGNVRMAGNFNLMDSRIDEAFCGGGENLRGLGSTLEGFGVNQFIYEYLFFKAWNMPQSKEQWVERLADRRLGTSDPLAREVWKSLTDSLYVTLSTSGQTTMAASRPCLEGNFNWGNIYWMNYDSQILVRAWEKMLLLDSERDTYRYDIVNFGVQALGDLSASFRDRIARAYRGGNPAETAKACDWMLELIDDIDRLAACERSLRFDVWEDDAAAFAATPEEEHYYRTNARRICTTWGVGDGLKDYASRTWSGLAGSYFKGRWQTFKDYLLECLSCGAPYDSAVYNARVTEWEDDWIVTEHDYSRSDIPEDVRAFCRSLYEKYFHSAL